MFVLPLGRPPLLFSCRVNGIGHGGLGEMSSNNDPDDELVHVHVCAVCGHASRREEPDGTPDTRGIFHCSKCGHEGPLNDRILNVNDARLEP